MAIGWISAAAAVRWRLNGCGSSAQGCIMGLTSARNCSLKRKKKPEQSSYLLGLKSNFHKLISSVMIGILHIKDINWDGALCFAVLHHIPGSELRQRICTSIGELLGSQKKLYLSVWQVNNSPRLMQRILPWSQVELNEADLDAGDVLMDWRAGAKGAREASGMCIFSPKMNWGPGRKFGV